MRSSMVYWHCKPFKNDWTDWLNCFHCLHILYLGIFLLYLESHEDLLFEHLNLFTLLSIKWIQIHWCFDIAPPRYSETDIYHYIIFVINHSLILTLLFKVRQFNKWSSYWALFFESLKRWGHLWDELDLGPCAGPVPFTEAQNSTKVKIRKTGRGRNEIREQVSKTKSYLTSVYMTKKSATRQK